jgi:hypothetical protein
MEDKLGKKRPLVPLRGEKKASCTDGDAKLLKFTIDGVSTVVVWLAEIDIRVMPLIGSPVYDAIAIVVSSTGVPK